MTKETKIGSTITRERDGAIGKVINQYLGSLIVEFTDGEGIHKEEVVVVPETEIGHGYKLRKSAAFHLTAEERQKINRLGDQVLEVWKGPAMEYMASILGGDNPVPPSDKTIKDIEKFIQQYSKDIVAVSAGKFEGTSFYDRAAKIADVEFRAEENSVEAGFKSLMESTKGTPAEEQVKAAYDAKLKDLATRKEKRTSEISNVQMDEIFGKRDKLIDYLGQYATSMWLENDVVPKIQSTIEGLAKDISKETGIDASMVMEDPVNPDVSSWGIGVDLPEDADSSQARQRLAAEEFNTQYRHHVEALRPVTIGIFNYLKTAPEYKAIMRVLPSKLAARLGARLNLSETPAQIISTLINSAVRMELAPRPTSFEAMPSQQAILYDAPERTIDRAYAEFSSMSNIPEERMMLHYRESIKAALIRGDIPAAKKQLSMLQDAASRFNKNYNDLLSVAEMENAEGRENTRATKEVLRNAMDKIKQILLGQEKQAAIAAGYGQGQPVRYKNLPGVHVIVSRDDSDHNRFYLIPEAQINTHERCELVTATLEDIVPLRTYAVKEGDLLDAYGTVGRVIDASYKNSGMVFLQLRGCVEVVPFELAQSGIPTMVATPIEICICEHDGGVITPDHKHDCPCQGKMMPQVPAISAPQIIEVDEIREMQRLLSAALDAENLAEHIPAEKPHTEVYDTEGATLEIGATVKRFGNTLTGTIIGRRHAAYVVDWENGASTDCWGQELVAVTVVEDAR